MHFYMGWGGVGAIKLRISLVYIILFYRQHLVMCSLVLVYESHSLRQVKHSQCLEKLTVK